MFTGSETVVRSQLRRALLSSAMIGAGVALLVFSSAFFLGGGPVAGIGLDSANADLSADAGLTYGPTLASPAGALGSETVDRLLVGLEDGLAPAPPEAAPTPPGEPVLMAAAPPPAPTSQPLPTAEPPAPPMSPPEPTLPPPPTPMPTPLPPPPPASLSAFESDILAGINAQRTTAGMAPLQLDSNLVMVARERSNDMAQKGYFAHVSPTGDTAFLIMDRYGIPYAWAGENLARNNYPDDESVAVSLRDWMASQGHRDNILGPHYQTVGVGAAVDGAGMKYFTLVFVGF